jgi:phosphoribosyl 1,2-cyclic phosphodiesterase
MNKHLKGEENIIGISGSEAFKIESFEITPFSVSHDAVDPIQFCVVSGHKKVSVATDLGFVSNLVVQRLNGSDIVIIESNYDIEMLKKGSYPWELKQRIMGKRGHLSNKNAAELIFNISQNGTKKVILAHLSKENNKPEMAERTIREIFEQYDKKINSLSIALQDEPTDVFEI